MIHEASAMKVRQSLGEHRLREQFERLTAALGKAYEHTDTAKVEAAIQEALKKVRGR